MKRSETHRDITSLDFAANGGATQTALEAYGDAQRALSAPVPAQDLHERGLPTPVCPDQAIAVAIAEFDGDILKERRRPGLHGGVGG